MISSEYGLSFSKSSGDPSLYQVSIYMKFPLMMQFSSCLYDKEWCIGIVEEVSVEDNQVKFLHPIFCWPAIEEKCWVSVKLILQLLSIPSFNTSGCHYTFLESELKDTQKQFTEKI